MGKPILWALGLLAVAFLLLIYNIGAFGKEEPETFGNLALDNAIGTINFCLFLMIASNVVVLFALSDWADNKDRSDDVAKWDRDNRDKTT